jgi:hypothetical protein
MLASRRGGSGSSAGQVMWDLSTSHWFFYLSVFSKLIFLLIIYQSVWFPFFTRGSFLSQQTAFSSLLQEYRFAK